MANFPTQIHEPSLPITQPLPMLGQRVYVRDEPGIIRFIGETQFAPGTWYGVELDNTTGKNDGSVNGVRYFDCTKDGTYGVFVRQALIKLASAVGSASPQTTSRPSSQSSNAKERQGTPRGGASPGPDSGDHTPSTLHKIIEKLQHKLQATTNDIKQYKEAVGTHENRTHELEGQLEMMSVDKDFLVTSKNELVTKLDDLQSKYDELKTDYQIMVEETELNRQIEIEIKSQLEGSETSKDVQIILQRNKQLENALLDLQKISEQTELSLKEEISTLKLNLHEKNIVAEDYKLISKKLSMAEETIKSLQVQLDSALSSEKIIEHLNLENERLLERVNYLQKSVEELTELHELDRSLEENQTLVEKELRDDLKNLSEVIRKDQALIKELEKKNVYLSSKLKTTSGEEALDGSVSDDTQRTNFRKEIEAYQLQVRSMKSNSLSDSIALKIAQANIEVLQTKLAWLEPTEDDSLAKALEVLYIIMSNVSNCSLVEDILKTAAKINSEELQQSKSPLQHTIKILRTFLVSLQKIWEHSYENGPEELLKILVDLDMSLKSRIEKLRELNTDINFGFFNEFVEAATKIVPYKFGVTQSNKYVFEFLLDVFIITDEKSEDMIRKIRHYVDEQENGGSNRLIFSELKQTLVRLSSTSRELKEKIVSETGALVIEDVNVDISDLIQTSTEILDTLTFSLGELTSGRSLVDENLRGLSKKLEQIADEIFNFDYEWLDFPLPPSIHQVLKANTDPSGKNDEPLEELIKIKTKYAQVTNSLLEKDRMLDDFQLNIQMLEGNMRRLNQTHSDEFNRIKSDLKTTHQQHQKSKLRVEELMKKNIDLEAEIQGLIKSNRILENGDLLGAFDNLGSEQEASAKLAMIEEIVLLRRMVQLSFSKSTYQQDISWLEQPLVEHKPSRVTSDFRSAPQFLRRLAHKTKPIKLTATNEWVPKSRRQKFVASALWEQATNYSCDFGRCV